MSSKNPNYRKEYYQKQEVKAHRKDYREKNKNKILVKNKMKNQKPYVECECGARVYGNSIEHAKSILPEHNRSKRHKELMEIKKRKEKQEDGE